MPAPSLCTSRARLWQGWHLCSPHSILRSPSGVCRLLNQINKPAHTACPPPRRAAHPFLTLHHTASTNRRLVRHAHPRCAHSPLSRLASPRPPLQIHPEACTKHTAMPNLHNHLSHHPTFAHRSHPHARACTIIRCCAHMRKLALVGAHTHMRASHSHPGRGRAMYEHSRSLVFDGARIGGGEPLPALAFASVLRASRSRRGARCASRAPPPCG